MAATSRKRGRRHAFVRANDDEPCGLPGSASRSSAVRLRERLEATRRRLRPRPYPSWFPVRPAYRLRSWVPEASGSTCGCRTARALSRRMPTAARGARRGRCSKTASVACCAFGSSTATRRARLRTPAMVNAFRLVERHGRQRARVPRVGKGVDWPVIETARADRGRSCDVRCADRCTAATASDCVAGRGSACVLAT